MFKVCSCSLGRSKSLFTSWILQDSLIASNFLAMHAKVVALEMIQIWFRMWLFGDLDNCRVLPLLRLKFSSIITTNYLFTEKTKVKVSKTKLSEKVCFLYDAFLWSDRLEELKSQTVMEFWFSILFTLTELLQVFLVSKTRHVFLFHDSCCWKSRLCLWLEIKSKCNCALKSKRSLYLVLGCWLDLGCVIRTKIRTPGASS